MNLRPWTAMKELDFLILIGGICVGFVFRFFSLENGMFEKKVVFFLNGLRDFIPLQKENEVMRGSDVATSGFFCCLS